jgi:methylated-DNA-protein-cysteine methyltransferase related protein
MEAQPLPLPLHKIADALQDGDLGFRAAVYATVCHVPHGKVLGYGHVAALMGRPRVARQVGYALAALEPGTDVPWWRVIRSDGSIALRGDPTRGPTQVARLRAEGIVVGSTGARSGQVDTGRVDMGRFRWSPQHP